MITQEEQYKFLHDLKQKGEESDIPNISFTNAKFLRDLIKLSHTETILELGTANGFSSCNFAFELKNNNKNGKIVTIEFSPHSHEAALENFKKAKIENYIDARLGNALDIVPQLDDNFFDFIFIDAMKKRSLEFFLLCLPKLKKGGYIIIDDVIKFAHKMKDLEPYFIENNISYNILPIDYDDGVLMYIN